MDRSPFVQVKDGAGLLAVGMMVILVMGGIPLGSAQAEPGSEPVIDSKGQSTRAGGAGFLRIAMQDDMNTVNTVIAQGEWDWKVLEWTQEGLFNKDKNENVIPWMMDNQQGDDDPETGFKTGYEFDPEDPLVGRAWIKSGIFWVQGSQGELSRIPRNCDPTLPWDPSDPDPNACEQVTAADVVFTYEFLKCAPRFQNAIDPLRIDIRDPSDPCDDILGVKVMDDDPMGLEFTLARTTARFVEDILSLAPYHIRTWSAHEEDRLTWQPEPTDVPGIGPMLFASDDDWKRDQSVRLTRNPFYFANDYGLVDGPYIAGIYYLIYKNTDTAVLALQNGVVDYIAWTIPPGYIPALLDTPEVTVEQSSFQGFFYMGFNFRNPALGYDNRGDPDRIDIGKPLRQAIAHATDKQAIVSRLLQNYGTVGHNPVNPTFADWYNEGVTVYDFDPQKAIDILEENGYQKVDGWYRSPNGDPIDGPGGDGEIEIITPPADYDPIASQHGLWVAENLKEIGINAVAKPLDLGSLFQRINEHDFEVYLNGWSVGGDEPYFMYDFFRTDPLDTQGGYNAVGYSNPVYDEIVDEMVSTMDRTRRINLSMQAQAIIAEDLVYNVIYYETNIEVYRNDNFEGWYVKELGGVFNQWTIFELRGSRFTNIAVDIVDPNVMRSGETQAITFKIVDQFGQPQGQEVATLNPIEIYHPGVKVSDSVPVPGQAGYYKINFTAPQVAEVSFVKICASAQEVLNNIDSGRTCESVKVFPLDVECLLPNLAISKTLYAPVEVQLWQPVEIDVKGCAGYPIDNATIRWSWSTTDTNSPISLRTRESNTDTAGYSSTEWRIANPSQYDTTYVLSGIVVKMMNGTTYAEEAKAEFRVVESQDSLVAEIVGASEGPIEIESGQEVVIEVKVTSQLHATPIAGATVEVIESSSNSIISIGVGDNATTDADGIATFVLLGESTALNTLELRFQARFDGYSSDEVVIQINIHHDDEGSWIPAPSVVVGFPIALAIAFASLLLARRRR